MTRVYIPLHVILTFLLYLINIFLIFICLLPPNPPLSPTISFHFSFIFLTHFFLNLFYSFHWRKNTNPSLFSSKSKKRGSPLECTVCQRRPRSVFVWLYKPTFFLSHFFLHSHKIVWVFLLVLFDFQFIYVNFVTYFRICMLFSLDFIFYLCLCLIFRFLVDAY